MIINNLNIFNNSVSRPMFKSATVSQSAQASEANNTSSAPDNAKAYASVQVNNSYRLVQNFNVAGIGKGKLYELSNGHKVAIIPKIGPTVINTYVKAGYDNEPANIKQISHLLEHLLAETEDDKIKPALRRLGGYSNAGTSGINTNYFLEAPVFSAKDLDDIISIQAKIMLEPNLNETNVADQKKIITQELDAKGRFKPGQKQVHQKILQSILNLKQSDPILAPETPSTINNIQIQDLKNYYQDFYQPHNMITTIVGSVDDSTIDVFSKYFSKAQNQAKLGVYPQLNFDNIISGTKRIDILDPDKDSELSYTYLSFVGPKNIENNDRAVLALLKAIYLQREDKLKKTIKDDSYDKSNNVIYSDDTTNGENEPTLIHVVSVGKNYNVERDLSDMYYKINNLTEQPVSEDELSKAKKFLLSIYPDVSEYALELSNSACDTIEHGGILDDVEYANKVNLVSAQDIQDCAKKYLDLNKTSIVVVHPQKSTFNKVMSSSKVSFGSNAQKLGLDDVHEYVLPNNLRVIIDSRPGIVSTAVDFKLHSKSKLYSNPDAPVFLKAMLKASTTRDELEDKEISDYYNLNSQMMSSFMTGEADKTMDLLGYSAGILLKPAALSKEKFQKIKDRIMKYEEENKKDNIYKRISDELMGESPYHEKSGEFAKDLSYEDVLFLYYNIMKNAQGTMVITIPPEQLQAHKAEIFETLLKIPKLKEFDYNSIFNKVDFKPLEKNKVVLKGEEDDDQLEIYRHYKNIESGNMKDRVGLILLSNILGGTTDSKLFKSLRVKDKIAYDPHSSYTVNQDTGKASRLMLGVTVKATSENLKTAFAEFDNVVDELISKPVSQEDLDAAKAAIRSGFISQIEGAENRNRVVANGYNTFYGVNYQEAFLNEIDNMTPEYIQELAKLYLKQPSVNSIIGNKKVLQENEEYLKSLGENIICE